MKLIKFIFFSVLLQFSTAQAGKVEDVQAAVKEACSKDIDKAEALRLVKTLALNCIPGSKVDVTGCDVKCLKENTGSVVGQ